MSNSDLVTLKQNRIRALNQNFTATVARLNAVLNTNVRAINASRRLSLAQKRQQINSLLHQYNTNVSLLQSQLSRNIAVIQSISLPTAPTPNASKRALLIGINYIGTSNELYGCINDVHCMRTRLLANGFQDKDIQLMTDTTSMKPTKSNILSAFRNLLATAKPGDLLFFMYSGHGSYTFDRNNDETTGYDQLIVPLDMNAIVDDELKGILQSSLQANVTLFAMFDSCFSGSVLDLRYQYMDSLNYDQFTENGKELETKGDVFMVSGCTDYQTSADAFIDNQANGAMTWSLLKSLKQTPRCSWRELVKNMRDLLRTSAYDQIPQFSSGTFENIDSPVFI